MISMFTVAQVFCQHLTNASLMEKPLLSALYQAVSIYTNYTGKTSCISMKNAEPGLDADQGWDYQACTEMVMPMCTDGINDMFEPVAWSIKDYNNTCFKKYSVSPQPYQICEQYGCEAFTSASNIVFRYMERYLVSKSSCSYTFLFLILFYVFFSSYFIFLILSPFFLDIKIFLHSLRLLHFSFAFTFGDFFIVLFVNKEYDR